MARALNQSDACTDMVSSYKGGWGEVNVHCRTVLSRDAERIVCLEGKATARTCKHALGDSLNVVAKDSIKK